nr:hypothetical protein [Candidatus Mycoplasma haematolamae]
MPDTFSFAQEAVVDNFLEKIHNEFNISLRSALREFTEFHVFACNYTGYTPDPSSLTLYFHFNYNNQTNIAKLEKIYFVSPEVKHVLTYNYLLEIEDYTKTKSNKKQQNKNLSKSKKELFSYEEKFKGLTFFSDYNRLESHQARKILLGHSWLREKNKQLLILKNLNKNYDDDSLKEAIIRFDFNFLRECSFFENERYAGFKQILPPNLMVDLPVSLEYELLPVSDHLRREQLIDLNSLKMDIQ